MYTSMHRTSLMERRHYGPSQVRTLKGIKPGQILAINYSTVTGNHPKDKIIVVNAPYQATGLWAFDYVLYPGEQKLRRRYLSDLNVVPFSSDRSWSNSSWLSRTGQKVSESRLHELQALPKP